MPRRVLRPGMLAGGDGSTLSLDFTAMSSLDSRFTFTRASTATYINSSGLVATMAAASTNDPTKARLDYDPITLLPRGLLIEGSATNSVLYSESFNAANWNTFGLNGGVVTSTSQTNPAGSASSIQIVENTSNSTHGIFQNVSVTSGSQYTFSVFARGDGTRTLVGMRVTLGGAATDYSVVFDLADGTTGTPYTSGTPGTVTPRAVQYGGGWWRLSVTMNAPSASTLFYIHNSTVKNLATSMNAYLGTGSNGVYVWGAQVEAGSGTSSYIASVASQGQRAADSCSIALSSFDFSTTGGTFFADWYRKNNDSGTASGGPWNTDYATSRWLGVQNSVSSNTVRLFSWSGQTDIANGSTRNKAAATYGAWTGSVVPATFCVNNSAVSSANRDFNPSIATYLTIGAASGSSGTSPAYGVATRDWLNNSIRSIKYWPSILPDATLQSLTA